MARVPTGGSSLQRHHIRCQALLIGEPRVTNREITVTLSSPDTEAIIFNDIYFVQVGRSVSRTMITNADAVWRSTDKLLDIVVERMEDADALDTA